MANKQTALRAKKEQKRKAVSKQKQKQANVKRNPDGSSLKMQEDVSLLKQAARQGIASAMRRAHTSRKRKGIKTEAGELTNKMVMENINEVIPQIVRLHAGIELFEILGNEKRFEITQDERDLIKAVDECVVLAAEDIQAISVMIEASKQPSDYQEVYVHMVEVFAQIGADYQPRVLAMLQVQGALIDTYANEHRGSMPMYPFMMQQHELRMLRVGKEYATQFAADRAQHDYTPDAPMPSDPVEPSLAVEPNLEQDVEAGRGQTDSIHTYEDIGGVATPDLATEQPQ